jgi:hypothetical protein
MACLGSLRRIASALWIAALLCCFVLAVSAHQQASANWHKLDAGPFSIFAPSGWEFHQLQGIDTYVGEFTGSGVALTFDLGQAASCYLLKETKQPTYIVAHELIAGYAAKLVRPRTPGHGITSVYFCKLAGRDALCLWGKDLTVTQQELVLKIFETIQFGGAMPPYVNPPPPPPKNKQ